MGQSNGSENTAFTHLLSTVLGRHPVGPVCAGGLVQDVGVKMVRRNPIGAGPMKAAALGCADVVFVRDPRVHGIYRL
jgi:hypothetical protein